MITTVTPRRSRALGICYLLYFATAILSAVPALQPFGPLLDVASTLLYVVVVVLFYRLFASTERALAIAALISGLLGCGLTFLAYVHRVPADAPLGAFGPFCMAIGVLVVRSRVVREVIGVLLVIAGVGWLAYLVPAINAGPLAAPIKIFGFLSELSLAIWLVAAGVPAHGSAIAEKR